MRVRVSMPVMPGIPSLDQPVAKGTHGRVMAGSIDGVLNDEPLHLDLCGFIGSVECGGLAGRRHTVVSGEWVGQDEDLAPEGWVG